MYPELWETICLGPAESLPFARPRCSLEKKTAGELQSPVLRLERRAIKGWDLTEGVELNWVPWISPRLSALRCLYRHERNKKRNLGGL